MLYKNKIKVQNILKSVVALMLMLTLSLSTALSPLAKAEEAKYTWKTLTSVPVTNDLGGIYTSPDGSKLFIFERDSPHNITSLWMSADDGTTWRKIFSKPGIVLGSPSYTVDGSKIVLSHMNSFHISTDGGQNWTEKWSGPARVSPDGSFLAGCSISGGAYTTYISTDDGHNWTQKGTNNVSCARYVSNNGALIAQGTSGDLAKSTDYGQTWTEISGFSGSLLTSFGNNGNTIFDGGNRISLDGGNHWTPSNAPIPAGYTIYGTGISDDGKKLFIDLENPSGAAIEGAFLMSVDGGRTWSTENTSNESYWSVMSSNGSKLLRLHRDSANNVIYRVGTLTTSQPVTPGAGAGGAAAPSASTSATPGQKPGKASGRLAETGTSTWMVGGLAVVAVAAGALVLRKRL